MPAYDASRCTPPAPVARVTLHHLNHEKINADILMQIDSGADVTLWPRSAVELLGIVGRGKRYQLIGFDGSTSESEAVRVVLDFLGRRFRGQFLLTDQEMGVAGRNVLNQLVLRLDGPALT